VYDGCVSEAELVISSKPEDDFLNGACSVCHAVRFHLTGNTLERKQLLRKMFDIHFRRIHAQEQEAAK
jgi:hypothetical protein